jgi:very-short-patch-repair endonuclease
MRAAGEAWWVGAQRTMADERARSLRKRMMPQEVRLWQHLRALRSSGHHFRRQAPIEGYIVDFACFRCRLVIEVDGSQHGATEHARRDAIRDATLTKAGFRVLRIWNNEVDGNLDGVIQAVMDMLSE